MKYNVKIALESRKDKTGLPIIKNVPIFAQISFAGNRIFYFTGYRIDTEKFDHETQEATKNSFGIEGTKKAQYNVINQRFRAIKAALELFFQSTENASKNEVISLLDGVCKKAKKAARKNEQSKKETPAKIDFYTMFERYQQDINLSATRRNSAGSILKHWKIFEAKNNLQLSFESVTSDLLSDFENHLKEQVSKNSIHTILNITRSAWNRAKKTLKQQGIEIHYPFDSYQLPGEAYGKPIYLTSAERDQLFNAVLPSDRLRYARDIFVFQCLVGARVGDLSKLTKANIQNNILSYIPSKTAKKEPTPISVPLNQTALEILSRYDLPGGKLLPFGSLSPYNKLIKQVFEIVGLTRVVTRQNPNTGKSEQVRICDVCSSHMARRCFVGTLFGRVDSAIIASMSGHTPNSKAFARYYKVDEELQKQAINLL